VTTISRAHQEAGRRRTSPTSRLDQSSPSPSASLTTAEALIGQLYPAILIAKLVGMALQARF
jgi:hypothetical protein